MTRKEAERQEAQSTLSCKERLLTALDVWIRQRPGLDPRNYISGWPDKEGRAAYFSEVRSITRDLHDARALLAYVGRRDSITYEHLTEGIKHAYSGRLTWDGSKLDYCTGQYWPTEYRRAVCAVLASVIWYRLREDLPNERESKADAIIAAARRELGRSIQRRWFT